MPQAVLATISPPAIFRTGSEMPKKCRTKRPKNRNVTRMTNTQRPVLKAVIRRSLSVQDDVMLKKIGTPPGGSTMGNNARNVAAAECGSVRRNCPSACVVAVMSLTDNRPALSPRAPAQPSKRPTAGAPAPRLLCREPHSLPESPPRHTPCIRPEHRWRGETRDGEAVPQAPAERAQRLVQPFGISWRILLLRRNLRARVLKMFRRRGHPAQIESVLAEFTLSSFPGFIEIDANLLSVFFVVVRQHVGIGHANYLQAKDSRLLLLVNEIWITKLLEPGKIVEHGVIHAIRSTGTHISRRHTQMLLERAVIGAAAQVTDLNIAAGRSSGLTARITGRFRRRRLVSLLPLFIDSSALGTGHDLGHIAHKLLQTGNSRGPEFRSRDRDIHVEIRGRAAQFRFMLLGPLSGADQSFFFAIPTAENHRALRLPARLQQFADSVHAFEHRRGAAIGVDCTVNPRVPMIARNHPLVRKLAASHPADDIPESAVLIILLEMHLHPHRSRSHVVGERQRPLPLARRVGPAEILKNGRGIMVGKWRNRNPGHLRRLLGRSPLVIRQRRQRCNPGRC